MDYYNFSFGTRNTKIAYFLIADTDLNKESHEVTKNQINLNSINIFE